MISLTVFVSDEGDVFPTCINVRLLSKFSMKFVEQELDLSGADVFVVSMTRKIQMKL